VNNITLTVIPFSKTKKMKKIILFFILNKFCNIIVAQQNLFNVPSSEITVKKGVFFQQQFNINNFIVSNTNLCYGLGKGFEIGANLIGLQTDLHFSNIKINDELDEEPIAPLGLVTFQKAFSIGKNMKIAAGTQLGTDIIKHADKPALLANFSYLNTKSTFFEEKLSVNVGAYYGNKAYVGEMNVVNFMAGFEATLSPKLHLVGDIMGGKNPIGVSVLGLIYYPKPHLPLSFGWQIPNSNLNASAFVFEITYVPSEK
jgi:hypothetical protein